VKKLILCGLLIVTVLPFKSMAQISVKAQAGLSYIEHFSMGGRINFSEKRSLSLLYGSNFFFQPANFSSVLLQYDQILTKQKIIGITPVIGLKGGYAIYSNKYYQWKLLNFIPFIGTRYSVSKKLDLVTELGLTGSFELAVKRISYGEIGNYKTILPEFKAGIMYTLFQK